MDETGAARRRTRDEGDVERDDVARAARRRTRDEGDVERDDVTGGAERASWSARALNLVRGGLIGTVETVPGVSGGTVALVVGVYETIITSAGHFLSGLRLAIADGVRGQGLSRSAAEFRQVAWNTIVPLLAGMFAALVIMARLLETWVEDYPVQTRALFFGLVLASLWVPFSMVGRWALRDVATAVVVAIAAYVVVSIPPGNMESTPLVIVLAAAVAVSALVLPGLSGSFLLLTFGLYERTLSAVNDRDMAYLGLFMLGAAIGLVSFVKLLQWLLEHHRRVALVVLTGVMAGCLRALWPWQDDDRSLGAPADDAGTAALLGVVGFLVVAVFLVIARRFASTKVAAYQPGSTSGTPA
ncbi:DUF368 domain-containing protein [Actinobacteria bacterium YIM 96077]|uniref:DUF368 domain-containing protein n=1 Tax=Phytoactinopolyspora halophila TaxID=1981511 RepID=A0A329QQ97_9ACTN|nr:DUF368 domain-containing protein [Phytoactinopolyspora halophila]AYY14542.1 DUF368 domain-containing protein [Actinobacteria bacterium YIM 96077]RAW14081.1 DUF368 domain-containing protein [Phytoactinopolyspora halophila]